MAKKAVRTLVILECEGCKGRNYVTEKNRRNDTGRLELQKYCPKCRAHKLHKETR
jgi:large subunit ribosomal protein L33